MKRCKHCGARPLLPISTCDYCGTQVGQGVGSPTQGAQISEVSRRGFDRLLQQTETQEAVARGPRVEAPSDGMPAKYSEYLLLFAAFGQVAVFFKEGGGSGHVNLLTVGTAMLTCWLVVCAWRLWARRRAYLGSHLESLPARLSVFLRCGRSGEGGDIYQVQIELLSGELRHLRYHGQSADAWTEGDYGVVHVKANMLVDFQPLSD